MSEARVRWGVTVLIDGERRRMTQGGKPCAWSVKFLALNEAAAESARAPERDPRIVKLTRKPRPKVVARMSTCDSWSHIRPGDVPSPPTLVADFIASRPGKRIRITLEELA